MVAPAVLVKGTPMGGGGFFGAFRRMAGNRRDGEAAEHAAETDGLIEAARSERERASEATRLWEQAARDDGAIARLLAQARKRTEQETDEPRTETQAGASRSFVGNRIADRRETS